MMKKILFIDDDIKYTEIMKDVLEKNEYNVDIANSSAQGIELAKENDYDAYIIDLYIDQFQGVQVGEILKMNDLNGSIIYISNSVDANDELRCLKTEGSEFIKKDASMEVFLERLQRVVHDDKKKSNKNSLVSNSEKLKIDEKNLIVSKDGENIHLTNTEFRILVMLLKHKNETLSRESIAEEIWKIPIDELEIELRTIDTHIKNIKRKLNIRAIVSVRGIGYRWFEKE